MYANIIPVFGLIDVPYLAVLPTVDGLAVLPAMMAGNITPAIESIDGDDDAEQGVEAIQ